MYSNMYIYKRIYISYDDAQDAAKTDENYGIGEDLVAFMECEGISLDFLNSISPLQWCLCANMCHSYAFIFNPAYRHRYDCTLNRDDTVSGGSLDNFEDILNA